METAFAYTAAHALDPAKPSIVFVHGAGLDHSWWGLQSRYFGYHGYNVLAVDLPGHGRSGGNPLRTIGEMADWVQAFLKKNNVKSATLVGHSMGALIALEFAARYKDSAERIAMIGTAFPMKVSAAFLDAAQRNDTAAYDMETIWGHAPRVPFGGNPNPGMWMYGDTLARLRRLAPGVLYADLKACNDYAAGLESAAKLACPVLFVLGERDMMTPPKSAQSLVDAFPDKKLVTIRGAGHSLMAEAPDATLDALIDFMPAAGATSRSSAPRA
jgi:pimeloyl-ACP methyl ester carboxylesterase